MDEINPILIERLRASIPEPIQALPAWLLWRALPDRGKVPFYCDDGAIRHGEQNGLADAAHLFRSLARSKAHGRCESAASGSRDLASHWLRRTGSSPWTWTTKARIPSASGLHDELIALAPGCYCERSPSGKGRRVLLEGNGLDDAKAHSVAWRSSRRRASSP